MADKKETDEKKKVGRKKKTTHSSGMYRKRITLGRDKKGKPIVKAVYGKTKDELENKIAQLRIDKGMGVAVTNDKSTWEYWAKAWNKLINPTVGKSAATNYKTALKHLSPLNEKKISKLTSIDLSVIISALAEQEYSKRTLNLIISTASQVCRLARKNHAMMFNIAEDVKPPKSAPVTKREAITPEEENLLWTLKALPANNKMDKFRAERLPLIRMFALMQLNCGLRREEAAALKWKNVDIKACEITIDSAYDFKAKEVKPPKSKAGYRTIPIPAKYTKELKAWEKANKNTLQGRKWVFTANEGIITENEFMRLWNTLLDTINGITVSDRISAGRKRKGIKPNTQRKYEFTSHQLRHTYATNCIAKGIDVRTVQYLMGHESPEMTMRYTHLSQAALDNAKIILNGTVAKEESKQAK